MGMTLSEWRAHRAATYEERQRVERERRAADHEWYEQRIATIRLKQDKTISDLMTLYTHDAMHRVQQDLSRFFLYGNTQEEHRMDTRSKPLDADDQPLSFVGVTGAVRPLNDFNVWQVHHPEVQPLSREARRQAWRTAKSKE